MIKFIQNKNTNGKQNNHNNNDGVLWGESQTLNRENSKTTKTFIQKLPIIENTKLT